MSDLIFYTNPQSRGRIVRWMLEEVGEPYETRIVDYADLAAEGYRSVNPMAKVPAIQHRGRTVTECAAICAYLADVFPNAGLGPRDEEKADYYRWMFFAAGPIEAAVSNKAMGWEPTPERERMFGYGNFDRAIGVIDALLSTRDYVCGNRFTAADVYVGSQLIFPMQFGLIEKRDTFTRYADRLQSRDAYKRAGAIDDEAQAKVEARQPQPA
jgi:glutathione S-transferase